MVDLIVTDANRVDKWAVQSYALDLAYGAGDGENDFELSYAPGTPGPPMLGEGCLVYVDGGEYGGMVADVEEDTADGGMITWTGPTWHGLLAQKIIQPDAGQDYLTVSGDATTVVQSLLKRCAVDALFDASSTKTGHEIKSYRFNRYVTLWEGLLSMCAANGLKLRLVWLDGMVRVTVEPVGSYDDVIDSDLMDFTASSNNRPVNHLIGLGKGDLKDRVVVHRYADANGVVSATQSLTGLDEVTAVYDYSNAEADELAEKTAQKLAEYQSRGSVDTSIRSGHVFDLGDRVTAKSSVTGMQVTATIAKKIVKISDGVETVSYETGDITQAEGAA